MTYHVLLTKEGGRWSVAFGDYDKQCVKDELDDCAAATGEPKSTFRIMTMDTDEQEAIDQMVDRLNYDDIKAEQERKYGEEGVYAFEALALLPDQLASMPDSEFEMKMQGALADMGGC